MTAIEPMLALQSPAVSAIPRALKQAGMAYEIKWDGERCIAQITKTGVTLWARSGRIINSEYPEIVRSLEEAVPRKRRTVTLDGEIIWMLNGLPDRQSLQNRRTAALRERRQTSLRYMAFDVLHFDSVNLMGRRYDERRPYLFYLEPNPIVQISTSSSSGDKMWDMVKQFDLEGLIAKPVASRYYPGRRIAWQKLKHNHRDVYEVVGYTSGEGTRSGLFGSLILAKQTGGEYLYGGKVGTGFTFQSARKLMDRMEPLKVDEPPIAQRDRPRAMQHITRKRPVTWIEPRLRAVIEFNNTSKDGIPLFPSFKGLEEASDQ